ncbi:MAG: ABC transporter ATP-binding protein [Alphaproteobacteria bacterium]|nr:ABC transporter ATP-binding protein [Alphaproteobacteria bacterium]
MSSIIKLENVSKIYEQGGKKLTVLDKASFEVNAGEIVALVGPSGSGKSTLLHIAGLLDSPSSGKIMMNGRDISTCNDDQRTEIRRHMMGFVYQFHYLQPEFSALENVVLPQMIAGVNKKEATKKAGHLLTDMGLSDRVEHRPAMLSGGEQQRVAIARALANDPQLLMADEPTGNLDPQTSDKVFKLLLDRVESQKIGALIATHNMDLAHRMDRILTIRDGKITEF